VGLADGQRSPPPRPAPSAPPASPALRSGRPSPARCRTGRRAGQGRDSRPAAAMGESGGCRRSRAGTSPRRSPSHRAPVISRRSSGESSACLAIWRSTAAISWSRNSTWRSALATVSASSTGSSSRRATRAPRPRTGRTPAGAPAAGARARCGSRSWSATGPAPAAPAAQPPPQYARPLIRRPDGVKLAGRQQPRQRAGVEAVGLRPRLADIGIGGADHYHPGHVRLEDPRDLPRAPGHLERHRSFAPRLRANSSRRSGVVAIRPADRSTPSSTIATSQKSRCTSNPIALPADLTSLSSRRENELENPRANDNDRYVLAAHPGKSQGRPPKRASSKLIVQTACPAAFSEKAPGPVRRP
jgi:hypothetical protein